MNIKSASVSVFDVEDSNICTVVVSMEEGGGRRYDHGLRH